MARVVGVLGDVFLGAVRASVVLVLVLLTVGTIATAVATGTWYALLLLLVPAFWGAVYYADRAGWL